MDKENLETRVRKAILRMEKEISGLYNVVRDLSLKLCHIIKSRKDYYSFPDDNHYRK